MGSRKEELLEMLKSTLALSKTSLRVSLKKPQQESSAATSQGQSGSKKDSQPMFSNAGSSSGSLFKASAEEEDDFLYGKTGAGVDRCSSSDAGYRFQKQGDPPERYRDHTSWRETSLGDPRGGRFDNPTVVDSSRSSLRDFAQNTHASSGPGQHKAVSAQSNSFLETDRFSPAYGSDKSSVDSSYDTSRMVDNILKSMSIDGDLSKIIAEKLKKSCEDAAAANSSQSIAEQSSSMIPVRIDGNVRSHAAEGRRFSEEYPSTEHMQSATYHHPAAVFPGDQLVSQESKNSSWNRKTEEFLRKLEIPQSSGAYEERGYGNDRMNFDQRKRLSTASRNSLTKSPSPVKKMKVQQGSRVEDFIDSARRADEDMFASSFSGESSKNASRTQDESRRIVMKPDASNPPDQNDRVRPSRAKGGLEDAGINKEEILDTINALEEEIRKLERRRCVMSSKPSTTQLQANINTNVQMQCEMKSQISTMRQIISEISSPVRGFARDEVTIRDDSPPASTGDMWDKQVIKDKQAKKMADTMARHETTTKGGERHSVASTSSQRSVASSRNGSEKLRGNRSPTKPAKEMSRQRSRSRSRPSDRMRNEKKAMPAATAAAGIHSSLKGESNIQIKKEPLSVGANQGTDKEPQRMIEDKVKKGIEYAVSLYMKAQRFYDCGNLWCQHCDKICSNVYELCSHLHTEDHLSKSGNISTKDSKSQGQSCGPNSAPARGEEFIKPVKAFYCALCEEFCKDDTILEAHFTGVAHNKKFQEFLVKDPNYEVPYLAKKMAVILKENTLPKESRTPNQTAPVVPTPVRTEQVIENRKVTATKKSDMPLENISITLLRKEPSKQTEGKEIGSGKQANSLEYRSAGGQGGRDQASMNLPKTYHVQPFKLVGPKK